MIVYRTRVVELPATPLGLLPARWKVEHWCTSCRCEVASEDLVEHAQLHAEEGSSRRRRWPDVI